ncbi:AAA family ATPase [uncultured Amnibacterium sp.]|uniref:AAA family ATPase n=1 Tax=uncultured Amnibacterium sp. TaxID=1631851 RepID=UPI0035C990FC
MRILRLGIEGFGPFAARQEIDFEALDEAGLFLITGRTGSGKSSILDAVCFALYGSAPRYDGGQARLRSDHADPGTPTSVSLELAVGTDRWRVVRSPEYVRPKRRGDGFTREPQSASLERWDSEGDGWVGVAARPVDVAEHLGPILRLTREQFLQVILLAQGRFQEFLRARSEDRLGLLRALFGTERFGRFEAEVAERAKSLEQAVGAATAALHADVGRLAAVAEEEAPAQDEAAWAAAVAARLAAGAERAEAAAEHARRAFSDADRAAALAVTTADRQRRRTEARAAIARLDTQGADVAAARVRIAAAVRVLPVLPSVQAAERADAALQLADRAAVDARRAVGEDVADPASAGAQLEGRLGALAEVLALERDLPPLASAVPAAEAAHTAAEEHLATLVAEADALPAQRSALDAALARAEAAVAGAAAADEALVRCRRLVAAVAEQARAAQAVGAADLAHEAALAREAEALARTRSLVTARLAGAAGLLAAELRPGDPCPVCGSAEHPHPAEQDARTPDEGAIALAEEHQRTAAEQRAAAGTAASSARAAHAAAAGAADGRTAAEAEDLLRDAVRAVDGCRAAQSARADAVRALATLTARGATLAASVDAARARLQQRAADLVGARSAHATAAARVAEARAGHPSVAEHAAGLRRRLEALRSLEVAERRLAQADADRQDAALRLDRALAEASVADAAAVRAAALPAAEREAQEARVRSWETARERAGAQLRDPDVAGAPDEPADVDGAAAAKAAALAARDAAAEVLAAARGRAAQGQQLAADIAGRHGAIAQERAELEVVGPLAEVVRGGGTNALRMRLESYVLASRLEQIVVAANARLGAMTDGRFVLQHDDAVAYRGARSGLGLEVLDEHTGRPRPVASLSGGETFLASLALALGLAEVVSAEAGGVRLDTLFVDEGFGSLDRRTLDTAMETLDSLRAGGRMVGLISHVEAMQEDIPAGLHVVRLPDGSSEVLPRIPAGV